MGQPILKQAVSICSNFPPALMRGLRERFGLEQFVETGTCCGSTAMLAAMAFPAVSTVEIRPGQHIIAQKALAPLPNVSCCCGDSREFLRRFDWANEPPTLIYLDAHEQRATLEAAGCDGSAGQPLRDELAIIGSLYGKHCLVIDDFASDTAPDLIPGWDCFIFGDRGSSPGSYVFFVATPEPCEYRKWLAS